MHIKTANGWRPLHAPCVNSNQLEGVYQAQSLEDAQRETAAHAAAFCKALEAGDFKFFRYPMTGAYGEKI